MRRSLPRPARPSHLGLAYGGWAAYQSDGTLEVAERERWLDRAAGLTVPHDYRRAYERFRASLLGEPDAVVEGTLASRLLVGHGNASPVGVGLTIHHTWGTPVISGSTLKGVLAHYLEATYGPAESVDGIDGTDATDPERARYAGPRWDGNRLVGAPGAYHRALFGAPDAPGPDGKRQPASRGRVVFHDAHFIPGSVEAPYARDVLTVHQRRYYGQGDGARSDHQPWPSDHDDPNPVGFLTVRPGAGFLIALTGDAAWAAWAMPHLERALVEWGVGGKTVAGYGRFVDAWRPTFSVEEQAAGSAVQPFIDWIEGEHPPEWGQRQIWEAVQADWVDRLRGLTDPIERAAAARAIGRVVRTKKVKAEVNALRDELEGGA